MAVIKKHATSSNVVDIGDGVFAEQVNYGTSTGGLRSVTDVIVRHMEDYNAKFIPNRLYNSTLGRSNLDFTVPANSYATINGRWVKVSTDETESVTNSQGTYIVYLTATNASSDEENRNPNTDTVSLEHVAVGSYVDSQLNLPVAKVVVGVSGYESHVDLHADGTGLMRVDSLRAFGGSDIHIYAGDFPQDSLVAEFRTDKFMTASSIDVDIGGDLILDSVTISAIQTSGESFVDNDTSLMTSAAILDKIQSEVTLEDLDVSGDTGTIAIDLDSETLSITGAPASAITTSASSNTLEISLSVHDSPQNGSTANPISSNWAYDHKNNASDHHTRYALTEDLTSGEINQLKNINSTTITSTQWGYVGDIDGQLEIGSGNSSFVTPIFSLGSGTSVDNQGRISITSTGNVYTYFWIPLPLYRNGKTLHISGADINIVTADTASYITDIRAVWNATASANDATSSLNADPTNLTAGGNFNATWTAKALGTSFAQAGVRVQAVKDAGSDLEFWPPRIKYYYA
jgi:hypothetical protein